MPAVLQRRNEAEKIPSCWRINTPIELSPSATEFGEPATGLCFAAASGWEGGHGLRGLEGHCRKQTRKFPVPTASFQNVPPLPAFFLPRPACRFVYLEH